MKKQANILICMAVLLMSSCLGEKNSEPAPFPYTREVIGEPGEWFVSSLHYVPEDGMAIYVIKNNSQDEYFVKDVPGLEYRIGLTLVRETIPASKNGEKQVVYSISKE